ncbi:unnamed protein product [Durusdinium trenchii]|uniref:RING-type domain-containing protein n=2 Tax=Durusdinium trenchii TaxID=1381693 RepID=A0ABP0NUY0_9DINO
MGVEDHELVHPDAISPTLRCPICTDVFEEPVSCSACQQVFCKTCIEHVLLTCKPACPTCRAPLTKSLQPNFLVRSLLNELHVRCVHPGCYWTGRLDERAAHGTHCLARHLLLMQEWKIQLENMRSVLVDGEKERSAMRRHIELLSSHKMQLEEEAKVQQLQLNAKQHMLDFKQQEVDELRCQIGQVMKQHHASHFQLHSLFPLLFLFLFVLHVWFFYDILPAVLGIRDCVLSTQVAYRGWS